MRGSYVPKRLCRPNRRRVLSRTQHRVNSAGSKGGEKERVHITLTVGNLHTYCTFLFQSFQIQNNSHSQHLLYLDIWSDSAGLPLPLPPIVKRNTVHSFFMTTPRITPRETLAAGQTLLRLLSRWVVFIPDVLSEIRGSCESISACFARIFSSRRVSC